jgi:hypothetical protein
MSVKIGDQAMTGEATRHTARRAGDGSWEVSWLPGWALTRDQATTAMMLAERVAAGTGLHDDGVWAHLEAWAAELGLSAPDAVGRCLSGEG